MRRAILSLGIATALMLELIGGAQAADCYYNGKRYSDGARNEQGQVCDGQTGTWK